MVQSGLNHILNVHKPIVVHVRHLECVCSSGGLKEGLVVELSNGKGAIILAVKGMMLELRCIALQFRACLTN